MVAVEKVTDAPIDVGARFSATTRSGRGTADMVIEITGFDRPHNLASTTSMATMDITGALTFEPAGQGTRLLWSWNLAPKGALKVMGPLIGLIGRRNERAVWVALKAYLEGA